MKFTIRPMGNAFEIRGQFWADMALVCSRCALDFKQKVSEKFHEILVIENELPRNGKLAKPNHTTELLNEGPFFSEVRSNTFDISEFLHEIIALAEPLSPTGKPNCDDSCEFYQQAIKEGWLSPEAEPTANQPFKVLDQLKSSQ